MLSHAARTSKPATKTTVKFDATKFRNRYNPAFAVGLVPPTRWTGQHDYCPFTQDDAEWLAAVSRDASAAEIDAEEQAYLEMLEAMALEAECVERYCGGHVAM